MNKLEAEMNEIFDTYKALGHELPFRHQKDNVCTVLNTVPGLQR